MDNKLVKGKIKKRDAEKRTLGGVEVDGPAAAQGGRSTTRPEVDGLERLEQAMWGRSDIAAAAK